MTKFLWARVSAILTALSVPVLGASIDSTDTLAMMKARGLATIEKRHFTAPLVQFSPYTAKKNPVVTGYTDPLGIGADPKLRIFSGRVQYMDLLGHFSIAKDDDPREIELPPGTRLADDLLAEFLSKYLPGQKRPIDYSLLNLKKAEVMERGGVPVTTETSPLSLAGFGTVEKNLRPLGVHWTRCPAQGKRLRVWEDIPKKLQSKFQPNPSWCYKI